MKLNTAQLALSLLTLLPLSVAHAQTPDKAAVQSAVTRLLKKPVHQPTPDMALALEFAEKSDDVFIEIVNGLVNVGGKDDKKDPALLGYYIAGAVQYDLANPTKARDSMADKVSAVRASLLLYRSIRAQDKSFKRPLLDNLAALDAKGKLAQHIRSVMSKQ